MPLLSWKKMKPGNTTYFLLLATVVGLLAGIGNAVFVTVTQWSHWFFFEFLGHALLQTDVPGNGWLIALLPVVGAFVLIPLSLSLPGLVNGYGFPKFLSEVHLKKARINPLRLIANTLGAAITIGSGGSAGREGPIAQIGGTIGSIVARFSRLSLRRTQVLVGCGVAGGIAATFNAPIAGVLFAEEIVFLGEMKLNTFSLFVISSVSATAISRIYYGAQSVFHAPHYTLGGMSELPLYAILGVLVGAVAAVYKKSYYRTARWFENLRVHEQLKPVLGAAAVGLMGIVWPTVLGDGYEVIHRLINGNMLAGGLVFVGLTIAAKMIATSLTLGSGGAGGLFAPSLFIGAALGAWCGSLFQILFPSLSPNTGAFAVVGMGALLGAATHAPLTAIFLLVEITGGYSVILPIMIATIIGTTVSEQLFHDSIDTHFFSLHGIPIQRARELSLIQQYQVRDVMEDGPEPIPESATLGAFIDQVNQSHLTHLPVVDEQNRVIGVISISDVRSFMFQQDLWRLLIVSDVMREDFVYLEPRESLESAMQKFDYHDLDDIPVLNPDGTFAGIVIRNRMTNFIRRKLLSQQTYECPISEL